LAEQFRKTYLSVREFVDSWEKEIYELNNMDYFIFLLINEVASAVEKQFFSRLSHSDPFFLQSDEIGTLAFSVGDALQLFFEKNCFGACPLNCPLKLDEKISPELIRLRVGILTDNNLGMQPCRSREECLYFDILNYVVLDTLLDFYSYEVSLTLNEENVRVMELAENVMKVILSFIRLKANKYLKEPQESATALFDQLLQSNSDSWEDLPVYPDEDMEDEEGEEWKWSFSRPEPVLSDFMESLPASVSAEKKILEKFREFVTDFLELTKIDELRFEDVEEFFTVVVVNELILEEKFTLQAVIPLFRQLISYLEFNQNLNLSSAFEKFVRRHFPEIERTFNETRAYKAKYPLINFLLSANRDDDTIVDGFFEITGKKGSNFNLEDIHLQSRFQNADLSRLNAGHLHKGDIVHGQLSRKGKGWKLIHLEMIYPELAKFYLF